MLTIQEIRSRATGIRYSYLAEKTGLSYHTVRHALKPGTNPSYETAKALSDYFEGREQAHDQEHGQ
jgi:DNA-binding phage protein